VYAVGGGTERSTDEMNHGFRGVNSSCKGLMMHGVNVKEQCAQRMSTASNECHDRHNWNEGMETSALQDVPMLCCEGEHGSQYKFYKGIRDL